MISTPLHQLTKNVKFLHKVAIIFEDKILLLKRSQDSINRPSSWDLPGGNSEWPEVGSESGFDYHLKDVVREIVEEAGIEVEIQRFNHNSMIYFRTYFDADKQIYTMICGWKLELETKPKVTISHEHTKHQWVKAEALAGFDFGGEKGEFIKEIIRSSNG